MSVDVITLLCKANKLRWTNHIEVRLLQRSITTSDVEHALLHCEILEQYPEAHPFPACLILGAATNNRYLHVVCGASDTELWLITAYYPDLEEWESNLKTRRAQ